MENQPVVCSCSAPLKWSSVACAVLAMIVPWFGTVLGVVGILLAVAAIVLAIVALCKKATAFGIIMIIVGLIAGAVATGGMMYSAAKKLGVMDQIKIQAQYEEQIQEAQKAGDLQKVEELKKEQQEALDQYGEKVGQKLGE